MYYIVFEFAAPLINRQIKFKRLLLAARHGKELKLQFVSKYSCAKMEFFH